MPAPQKEHQWLQKFVGQWNTKTEITLPGQDPMTVEGTESVKSLGGFWIVADLKCDLGDQQMHGIMTVGYDPQSEKYIGTWIDSMGSHLWKYEGDVDESGKKLILNSEGPCPMKGGQMAKMRDVVEFHDDDTRTLTSYAQDDDGKWQSFMKMTVTRKK
ncbi:MAG: DUF1579 domain-containing protein [Pirellulales bacterium]|nr:DUF1579 domain-containing protein [Pirellulales bacterium]